jgi:hypothetical protein
VGGVTSPLLKTVGGVTDKLPIVRLTAFEPPPPKLGSVTNLYTVVIRLAPVALEDKTLLSRDKF